MSNPQKTIEYKGHTIEIYPDETAENPIKEWDMLGARDIFHTFSQSIPNYLQ